MRKVVITNAPVSDSVVFQERLDPNTTSRNVYAHRGYPTAEREATLTAGGRVHIQRKRRIATPRAQVEHVFGTMRHMGGKLVRCMGIMRATLALHFKSAS